jgi:uncharacterized BrkB/YihY/UPF0761 family membrane protein
MAGIMAPSPGQLVAGDADRAEWDGGGAGGVSADVLRLKFGALIIVAAFVLLGVVFAVSITHFTSAADVTAVVGSVATVVGTIVGAYFGIQVGSHGKEAATAARDKAELTTQVALAALPPEDAEQVLRSV